MMVFFKWRQCTTSDSALTSNSITICAEPFKTATICFFLEFIPYCCRDEVSIWVSSHSTTSQFTCIS